MRLRVSATGFRVSLECPSNEQGCIVRLYARIQLGAILHCENFASELRVRTKTQEWLVFKSNIFLWLLLVSTSFSRFVCFTQSTLSFEIVHILAILVIKKYENSSYHVLLVLLTITNINVRQQIFKTILVTVANIVTK